MRSSVGNLSESSLPSEVVASGFGGIAGYPRFSTFSWAWFWRRGWVFWPLAFASGSAFALYHALTMHAWTEFAGLAWRAIGANLILVSLGPMLATFARSLDAPSWVTRATVLASISAGVVAGALAGDWARAYHDMLMGAHTGANMAAPAPVRDISRAIGEFAGDLPNWVILVWAGGGFALYPYLTERKRLAEYQSRRDVEILQSQKDIADMRLAVLQAQIEPHFLFNTLASVRSLIGADPARAAEMIDALADYLRAALPKLRAESGAASTLGEQLDLCARYLELMNVRMGGRLQTVMQVDPTLRDLPFPPLMLISITENAVKHGLEPKAGAGQIIFRAKLNEESGTLDVTVEDDGVGLSSGAGNGVGLANIRAQLAHRYGERATLSVVGAQGSGVRACISIPA